MFLVACLLGAAVTVAGAPGVKAQAVPDAPAPMANTSGMKVPRYVSLKADHVLLRQGPGAEYPTAWVFKRTGLPVEIVEEIEVWRKVRDAGGTVGWVHMSLLSGRRTALILPWEIKEGQAQQPPSATLRDDDRESARAIAQIEAGVLAGIIGCENGWCRVSVGSYRGYIEQSKLWGTYPNEQIKQ
jgi:SH3-like domain-containing protein